MLKNYFVIAIRNIARHKVYSLINIVGLAVGIACCGLIGLYMYGELRVDQFHKNGDRIYRLVRETNIDGERDVDVNTSGGFAQVLKDDFPEVEQTTRFVHQFLLNLQYGDQVYTPAVSVVDHICIHRLITDIQEQKCEAVITQPSELVIYRTFM